MVAMSIVCDTDARDSLRVTNICGPISVQFFRDGVWASSVHLTPDTARQLRDHLSEALGDTRTVAVAEAYGEGYSDAVADAKRTAQPVAPIPPGTVKCAEGLGDLQDFDGPADPDAIRAAEVALGRAFRWNSAPEGGEFWCAISDRLTDLARLAETAARRPKVPEPVEVRDFEGDLMTIRSCISGVRVMVEAGRDAFCFNPAQAREAAAALEKMADALEGVVA
jgi:hypothetical protein